MNNFLANLGNLFIKIGRFMNPYSRRNDYIAKQRRKNNEI